MSNAPIVYVVDDDVGVRKALSFLLVSAGLNVRLYESAKAFLEEVVDPGRCCIVTDVRMPGIDGLETMARMLSRDNRLPIILNSAYSAYRESFLSWSADAYVIKSSDLTELKAKIRQVLADRAETEKSSAS